MYERDLLIWAAGVLDGCGMVACTVESGPNGHMYHALTLLVPLADAEQIRRLTIAAGNGSVSREPVGFELGGKAAVKGFLEAVWQWLSPGTRKRFNIELRRFKMYTSTASIQG